MAEKDFSYDVIEEHGLFSESQTSDFVGVIRTVKWSGQDEEKVNIARINLSTNRFSKGGSFNLTKDEAHKMTEILANGGFGNTEKLKEIIEEREKIYEY